MAPVLPSFSLTALLLFLGVALHRISFTTALAPVSLLSSAAFATKLFRSSSTTLPASFFEDNDNNDDDDEQDPSTPISEQGILVVGATGGTGLRALQGLLDVGWEPSQIRLLSRNPDSPVCQALQKSLGVEVFKVDLDHDADSNELCTALQGCSGCYIHALTSDTRKVTKGGTDRARTLAFAIAGQGGGKFHVVLNSAAGEPGHGVQRIQEMHDIERVCNEFSNIRLTSLRANLFMEEFWKTYIRPSVIKKGKFPFSVPSDRKLHLTSVRDMGKLAGICLKVWGWEASSSSSSSSSSRTKILNVAGDVLTAEEIAATFAEAQESPCQHSKSRVFGWFARLFFRDLYQIIRFYRRTTETTDVADLRQKFPGMMTDFATFLNETEWGNRDLSFANFTSVERILSSQ